MIKILTALSLPCWVSIGPVCAANPGVLRGEFIYETAPFPSCHASTIVESHGHLAAAWFGGKAEKSPDVGIWTSRLEDGKWTAPKLAADGVQSADRRFPCWNPVLFQPKAGPLLLFYKVGPNPDSWWGMLRQSDDGGRTWSAARQLPAGILGPIKNKPVQLADGTILCGSSTEDKGWRIHFERTADSSQSWSATAPVNDGKTWGLIQPTILRHKDGRLQALCRSQQKQIVQTFSSDAGLTWSPPGATTLPNPNSGIDAVTLADGRFLVVYNHTSSGRTPLNVAVSADGTAWQAAAVLENDPGEYSYPAVIQSKDGAVHITYTWKRQRIEHVVIDPTKLMLRPMPDGKWPKE